MFARMNEIDKMFGAMDLLRTKMDRIFNEVNRPYLHGPAFSMCTNSPRTNLMENGDSFEVRAELPGISKDDISIKIQGNYLEISGKRSITPPEGYKAHRNERAATTFSRSFTLPDEVDAEKVDATLKNGILYLTLPKSEATKPRQITIS
ncbi:MAG: Hsp20/alpha crystallin family protein [Desulfobacterales bacterium]|nr:Hsp20/alpha crystallin family protein [Desulfobacterales bacterium]